MWKAIISRFLCLFHHFWKEAVLTGCFIFHLLSSNVFNFLIRNSLKGKRRNFLFFSRYELKVCPLSLSISLPGITGKLSVMKLERQRMCFFFVLPEKRVIVIIKTTSFFFPFRSTRNFRFSSFFFLFVVPFFHKSRKDNTVQRKKSLPYINKSIFPLIHLPPPKSKYNKLYMYFYAKCFNDYV